MSEGERLGSPSVQYREWFGEVALDSADIPDAVTLHTWLGMANPLLPDEYFVVGADITMFQPDFFHGEEETQPISLTLYAVEANRLPEQTGLPGIAPDDDGSLPVVQIKVPDHLVEKGLRDFFLRTFKRMQIRVGYGLMQVSPGDFRVVGEIDLEEQD